MTLIEPTPKTITSASLTPRATALLPIMSPTLEAAKGVPFLAPLKPKLPALDQNNVLPTLSAKSTFVLLKVASTCKTQEVTFFFDVLGATFLISTSPVASFLGSSDFVVILVFHNLKSLCLLFRLLVHL